MFYLAESFNRDISSWNMSKAPKNDLMFFGAKAFNQVHSFNAIPLPFCSFALFTHHSLNRFRITQDISVWSEQLNLENGYGMFWRAESFNQVSCISRSCTPSTFDLPCAISHCLVCPVTLSRTCVPGHLGLATRLLRKSSVTPAVPLKMTQPRQQVAHSVHPPVTRLLGTCTCIQQQTYTTPQSFP